MQFVLGFDCYVFFVCFLQLVASDGSNDASKDAGHRQFQQRQSNLGKLLKHLLLCVATPTRQRIRVNMRVVVPAEAMIYKE